MCEYRDRRKEELTRETAAVHTELKSEERVEDGLYRQQTQEQDEGFENPVIRRGEETQEGIIEAVPVCASAPVHLDAHVRTDFENKLSILKNDVDNVITAVKALNADNIISAQAVSVLEKFRVYADLRTESMTINPKTTLTAIDIAVSEVKQELKIFFDRKQAVEQEYQDLLTSATRTVTVPDSVKENELKRKLDDIAALEPLLASYQNFVASDRYKGGMTAAGPISSSFDSAFTLPSQKKETINGIDYVVIYDFMDVHDRLLFPEPPCISDIVQGGLGDCYLLAGLASAVATNPDLIVNAMQDMGDKVCVRFYQTGGVPLYVEVEKKVPKKYYFYYFDFNESSEPKIAFAGTADPYAQHCLWVQMMEKAYMASGLRTRAVPAVSDSYSSIAVGFTDIFLEQLTGRCPKREYMSDRRDFGERNSLIGVYQDTPDRLMPAEAAVLDKMLPVTSPATFIHGVETGILRNAATGIFLRNSTAAELSMEGAIAIALKIAEEEQKRAKMKPDTTGTNVRTLDRAAYLDDLKTITGISIPVPASHALDTIVLDELALNTSIAINEAEGGSDELFDQLDDSIICAEGTRALAVRIQNEYRTKAHFISMNNAVTLAADYETRYKKRLVSEMIKTLKKDLSVNLAYSPFYTRKPVGKDEDKKRYTRRAKNIYKMIEDAIAAGKMVTADTVDYQQNGDRARKDGLVEGHAYSILGTEEKNNARFVRVRNPWGIYERSYNPAHNAEADTAKHGGVFLMELNDFISNFNRIAEN